MAILEVNLFSQLISNLNSTKDISARFNSKKAVFASILRETAYSMFHTAYHAITVIGIAALATSALLFYSPALASQIKSQLAGLIRTGDFSAGTVGSIPMDMPSSAPFGHKATDDAQQAYAGHSDADVLLGQEIQRDVVQNHVVQKKSATDQQRLLVTNWISKRYRVATNATDMLVAAAYTTSSEIKLDPLLILAVVAIESGFNPFAESAVGAQGLMQVMSKIHQEKFQSLGGIKAALNPVANIKVGSSILKSYVARGGSVEAGLKMYVGAAAFDNDAGYGSKVLAEYRRLKDVASGKSVSTITTSITTATRSPQNSVAKVVAAPHIDPPAEDKPLPPEASSNSRTAEQVAEM